MSLETLPHLFVEGKTDEYAITHLLMQHGIAVHASHGKKIKKSDESKIEVVVEFLTDVHEIETSLDDSVNVSGGRDKLLDGWWVSLRSPKPRAIGLVLDADTVHFHSRGLAATWASIQQRLSQEPVNITAASNIEPDGFFGLHGTTGTPLGVWIMPDNSSEGTTEDFLLRLIAEGNPLRDHAEASTLAARQAPFNAPFADKDFSQAVLATWLAWQKNPPMTFGTAFQHHVLSHEAPLAERFVAWVRRLIDSSASSPTT